MQIPRYWRLNGPRYRLEATRDPRTGALRFPPPAHDAGERVALSGLGVVESFAQVGVAAAGFQDGALMALIRLEEGPLITAELTDVAPEQLRIGMPVEMVTRVWRDLGPDGLLVYGYKFRPRLEACSD
ncbi:Zn-ribbon domain-containing OB-fold protein [Kallotenue papyrolyticum]|uniref:Zn-ribbon domain-containing OB-fold protein n=1 Tax=Kallotenue papyrolyticum TaxID=1325125 RepID=UPI00047852C5|nr:Zn-ribbon domain-containing OB-fold protein [Kallotenue papyrolyticum]